MATSVRESRHATTLEFLCCNIHLCIPWPTAPPVDAPPSTVDEHLRHNARLRRSWMVAGGIQADELAEELVLADGTASRSSALKPSAASVCYTRTGQNKNQSFPMRDPRKQSSRGAKPYNACSRRRFDLGARASPVVSRSDDASVSRLEQGSFCKNNREETG